MVLIYPYKNYTIYGIQCKKSVLILMNQQFV